DVVDGCLHRFGHDSTFPVRANASLNAIHASSAHLPRAGYFATPANAVPSPSTSSSGSTVPRLVITSVNASPVDSASATLRPRTNSYSTLADAWLIEQPMPWYETSSMTPSPTRTRSVISSPQVGFTWWASASYGSRRPRPCGCL